MWKTNKSDTVCAGLRRGATTRTAPARPTSRRGALHTAYRIVSRLQALDKSQHTRRSGTTNRDHSAMQAVSGTRVRCIDTCQWHLFYTDDWKLGDSEISWRQLTEAYRLSTTSSFRCCFDGLGETFSEWDIKLTPKVNLQQPRVIALWTNRSTQVIP